MECPSNHGKDRKTNSILYEVQHRGGSKKEIKNIDQENAQLCTFHICAMWDNLNTLVELKRIHHQ